MTQWIAPGAGGWRRDDSHITTVLTGYTDDILIANQMRGFREGFAFYGAMLDGFDAQYAYGRWYLRPRIAGAPKLPVWGDSPPAKIKGPGKPPPKLIFKLLFKLHPEMRRRAKRAAEVWRTKAWREVAANWQVEKPGLIAVSRELTRIDVTALDDAALADHVAKTTDIVRETVVMHFRHSPMQAVVVGDFLARATEWTSSTQAEVLAVLVGASPASRAGADAEFAIARALDEVERALVMSDRPAAEIVETLRRAKSAAGDAMRELLEVYGLRLITGLDMQHQTLAELPDLIVRGLRAAITTPHKTNETDALAALRAKTPAEHHAELQEAFEDVRTVYGVRDDDAGILLWRMGIARRAVLEAGKRLAARGALSDAMHVVDVKGDEIVALLRGGTTPSASDVAARVAKRAELDALCPPVLLGEEGARPALDCFPPAVARMVRGVDMFLHAFEGEREPDATGVRGTGVSAGVYEGRARVVRDAADFHRIEAGDVLVARFTSPAYNALLPLLGAIVTERGGLLSHAAIVAREYGIPAVVDTRNALERISDGALVRVDGTTGVVEVLGAAPASTTTRREKPVVTARPRVAPKTPGRVVALNDAGAAEFGGKARALAAAIAAKLPVPDGVALDADLVERVVNGEADARERVRQACAQLRGPWAVRSSAIGEDSAAASFAGQHATILGVKPEELFDAIDKVHASGHTASAQAYRARMKIDGVARMGVVIQTLLRPDISGVLFSKDPTKSARDGRLIEATWGLGEALVSGLVTPDRYRVASDGKVIERAIGDKDLAIEPRDGGGTAEVTVGADRAKSACLDDAQLAELSQLANRCEQLFGGPQDLEWAVANGQLHLLQSRPVTTA